MAIVLWVAVATFLASLFLTPLVIRVAAARGLLHDPADARHIHTQPVPRLGGVAIFLSLSIGLFGAGVGGWLPESTSVGWTHYLAGMLLGGTVLFLAGLWDDLRGLSPLAKLLVQCAAAVVVFLFGFRVEILGIGSTEIQLGLFSLPLTVIWVVAITNAFNLIDGLDGLATGIAVVALSTTLAVSLALGNLEITLVSGALLGSLLGFLRYNFNPARIFLGDSGSLFVGFMLAVLSVHGSLKSATVVLAFVPLFALAIPLLDTSLAILRRWLRGMPLSGADSQHIHHRLLATGLSHRRAVGVLYVAALLLAILGVSLAFAPPTAVLAIAVAGGGLSMVLLLIGMRHLQYHEFIEAGAVIAYGALRMRRVIQDQIHARDIADLVADAQSISEINAILESGASRFCFLGMELCRETAPGNRRLERMNGDAARAWKLDYPVTPRASVADDPFVLRIWCGPGSASRPHGAERIARLLAPSLEKWLVQHSLVGIHLLGHAVAPHAVLGTNVAVDVVGGQQAPLPFREPLRKPPARFRR